MEYLPTTTEDKPLILSDRDYMFYEMLKRLVNILEKLDRRLGGRV